LAATSKFAWNKIPPTALTWRFKDDASAETKIHAFQLSLLRLGPVALKWLHPLSAQQQQLAMDAELRAFTAFTNTATLVSLRIQWPAYLRDDNSDRVLTRIPTLAGLGTLRALYMPKYSDYDVPAFCRALATHVPQLHTLSLQNGLVSPNQPQELTALAQMEHLTHLTITGYTNGIETCRHLKRLSIISSSRHKLDMNNVLTSPSLCTVQHLSITSRIYRASHLDAESKSWTDILNNLNTLTSLTLRDYVDMSEIDAVVSALVAHECKMLRTLRFASHGIKVVPVLTSTLNLPSVGQLGGILIHLSSLTALQLELPTNAESPFIARVAESYMNDVCNNFGPLGHGSKIELLDYIDCLSGNTGDDDDDV